MPKQNQYLINNSMIACVTGATGLIGSYIVKKLLARGIQVRVLTRDDHVGGDVQVFKSTLLDKDCMEEFIKGANMVFHCAAELHDELKMHDTNILGTENIVKLIERYDIQYYCHLSSAGVIGKTSHQLVNETIPCNPKNLYEYTKLESERIASRMIPGCHTVILRPTNVVGGGQLGALALPIDGEIKSRLKVFVKGGECAHIVHAEDVANAALFFLDKKTGGGVEIYFVSLDDDPLNTVGSLWSLYQEVKNPDYFRNGSPFPHLPVFIPYMLRTIQAQSSNSGRVKYTSQKIFAEGFRFQFNVKDLVNRIMQENIVIG